MKNAVNLFGYGFRKYGDAFFCIQHIRGPKIFFSIGVSVIIYCFFIIFPCFLVGVAIAGEGTELLKCRSVDRNFLIEKIPEFNTVGIPLEADFRLCWSESSSEIGGGSIKSLDSGKSFCEKVSDWSSQQSTQNSAENGCDSWFYVFSFGWWLIIFIVSILTSYLGHRFVDWIT